MSYMKYMEICTNFIQMKLQDKMEYNMSTYTSGMLTFFRINFKFIVICKIIKHSLPLERVELKAMQPMFTTYIQFRLKLVMLFWWRFLCGVCFIALSLMTKLTKQKRMRILSCGFGL